MFHFRKRDKSERKKEKDDKKRREKSDSRVTIEELRRLEEARVSMLGRTRKKDKLPSGITADYMANFTRAEREALAARSGSSSLRESLTRSSTDAELVSVCSSSPPPPRPPKRGVHKSGVDICWDVGAVSGSHRSRLGSVKDGVMNYERLIERRNSETSAVVGASPTSGGCTPIHGRPAPAFPMSPAPSSLFNSSSQSVQQLAMRFEAARRADSPASGSASQSVANTQLSAASFGSGVRAIYSHSSSTPSSVSDSDSQRHLAVDCRDSSTVTSLCSNATGAASSTYPGVDLRLPSLCTRVAAVYRDVTVTRCSDGSWPFVIGGATGTFAHQFYFIDVARCDVNIALLPGDRLVEVNGNDVTSLRHENVLSLLAKATDPVSLKVLTAAELSEVVRCHRETGLMTNSSDTSSADRISTHSSTSLSIKCSQLYGS